MELHILTPDADADRTQGGAHVHRLPGVRITSPRTSNWRFQWLLCRAIPRLAQAEGCEFIHFNTAFFGTLAVGSLRRLGYRVLVNVNDYYDERFSSLHLFLESPRDWWLRWTAFLCEQHTARRASTVLFNSEFNESLMRRRWRLSQRKTSVVYNAVDSEQFFPQSEAHRKSGPLRLLFIGKYWERKGLADILLALVLVKEPICLTVVGLSGTEPRLGETVSQLGLESKVQFLGIIPRCRIAEVYRENEVLLLPSLREAFGVVALEAMASGLPVVATRVGGLQKVVEDGVTGILVPPRCPEAIARAVQRLVDAEVRAQFGCQGRERAKSFSIERLASSFSELYGGSSVHPPSSCE